MPNTALTATSALVLIFGLLLYPIATTLVPSPRPQDWALSHVKTAIKLAFFVSLLPLSVFLNQGAEEITTICTWINTATFDVTISFKFDFYSLIFMPVALYVSWSILEFAS